MNIKSFAFLVFYCGTQSDETYLINIIWRRKRGIIFFYPFVKYFSFVAMQTLILMYEDHAGWHQHGEMYLF